MKAFTDILQSKELAKILPLESADMCYLSEESLVPKVIYNGMAFFNSKEGRPTNMIYCWSLAALLSVLPIIGEDKDTANPFIAKAPTGEYYVVYATLYKEIDSSGMYSNPIDACCEMIIHLHEQNLL